MISVICRTKGRPGMALRMANSAIKTAKDKEDIEILFYVDDIDNEKEAYLSLPSHLNITVGKDYTVNATNILCQKAKGEILLLVGDDVVFESDHWDKRIKESFPNDKIALISFDDGKNKGPRHPHTAFHRKWFDTLGYANYPVFHHWKLDTWLAELATKIGRLVYLKDVLLAHHKVYDSTALFLRYTHRPWHKEDYDLYEKLAPIREEHAKKLLAVMDK